MTQHRTLGHDVRIVTRDVDKAPAGVEAVQGDFTKGDLSPTAFEGVKRVFLFPVEGGVDAFLKQAQTAGVEQIVVLSSLAAAMEFERDNTSWAALHHLAIENAVKALGIPYTSCALEPLPITCCFGHTPSKPETPFMAPMPTLSRHPSMKRILLPLQWLCSRKMGIRERRIR